MNYKNILGNLIPELSSNKYNWLVTGAAGFIGSHLTEALLQFGQNVTGLDDLSTGYYKNIAQFESNPNFNFIHGSICDTEICEKAANGINFILNHAALASVPGSLENPTEYLNVNSQGFINILESARKNKVQRVIFASSSAVYGDGEILPKIESDTDSKKFLSPYALTKYINEICAQLWTNIYKVECVGLRYFNVFGVRQDPNGAYAAVIPKWINAVLNNKIPVVYGDGNNTRDFCAVQNVVLANFLSAFSKNAPGKIFNIGCGHEISLNELLNLIYKIFAPEREIKAEYLPARKGDIMRSYADINSAMSEINFKPVILAEEGLKILSENLKEGN